MPLAVDSVKSSSIPDALSSKISTPLTPSSIPDASAVLKENNILDSKVNLDNEAIQPFGLRRIPMFFFALRRRLAGLPENLNPSTNLLLNDSFSSNKSPSDIMQSNPILFPSIFGKTENSANPRFNFSSFFSNPNPNTIKIIKVDKKIIGKDSEHNENLVETSVNEKVFKIQPDGHVEKVFSQKSVNLNKINSSEHQEPILIIPHHHNHHNAKLIAPLTDAHVEHHQFEHQQNLNLPKIITIGSGSLIVLFLFFAVFLKLFRWMKRQKGDDGKTSFEYRRIYEHSNESNNKNESSLIKSSKHIADIGSVCV